MKLARVQVLQRTERMCRGVADLKAGAVVPGFMSRFLVELTRILACDDMRQVLRDYLEPWQQTSSS